MRSRNCFPSSVNFLDFFLAACSKVFLKVSLSLMKEQVSQLAKSTVAQYATAFRLILAKTGETLILGLRWKGIILRALMCAVTSLWPQKVVLRSQICSVRAKLTLISDHTRDLVRNCFQGGPPGVPFKTAHLQSGS